MSGRHSADARVAKAIARILRSELIVIDDIGLLPGGEQKPHRQ